MSAKLKASGRRRKSEAVSICRLQTEQGHTGSLVKVPAAAVYSFLNHLHYSLGSAFVPAVAFPCTVPADKIWQAQKKEELGEPH